MNRKVHPHEGLVSWLKFFDINYLDKSLCNQLSELDINQAEECAEAIQLAVIPEFESLNEASKASMLQVLKSALMASDNELEALFSRVSMPFHREVANRTHVLQCISEAIDAHSTNVSGNV